MIDAIVARIADLGGGLVTVTGGEPLAQAETPALITALLNAGCEVLVETSGALDIQGLDRRAAVILDVKCPSSGEEARNRWENAAHLKPIDELKFVIASREDYDWAVATLHQRLIAPGATILFSWAAPLPTPDVLLNQFPANHHRWTLQDLAQRVIADRLPVRVMPQLHKVIWGNEASGV